MLMLLILNLVKNFAWWYLNVMSLVFNFQSIFWRNTFRRSESLGRMVCFKLLLRTYIFMEFHKLRLLQTMNPNQRKQTTAKEK